MTLRLSQPEFDAVRRLSANKRFEYLVKRVADQAEIWSLRNKDGWVLGADDQGREMHPVWPHPRFAEASAVGDWSDTEPARIALKDWLGPWTDGMAAEGKMVAVFPTETDDDATISPEDFAEAIHSELDKLE